MQSKKTAYLERLIQGKPIHLNWMKATTTELSTVRKLWAEGLIECVKVDAETMTATYQAKVAK